jgi:single-strand DNA-binding protein
MSLITVMGFLGRDAEVKNTQSGIKMLILNVATTHGKDTTVWYRIVYFGDRHDKMIPYLKKGSALVIVGELKPPTIYTSNSGEQKVNLEVIADSIRFAPFGKKDKEEPVALKPQMQQQEQYIQQDMDFSDLPF